MKILDLGLTLHWPRFSPWQCEYARYMVESTPQFPYDGTISGLLRVENNMETR